MMVRTLLSLGVAAALLAAPANAMTTDGESILRLIRSTPKLQIDRSMPAPGEWNRMEHPFIRIIGAQGVATGFIDPDSASSGRFGDGMQVMAVPLYSGGSGGVFTQLIFAQNDQTSNPYYVGYIDSGGHLAVNITYHNIVAVSPHYGPNDANCCPSKYDTRTYSIVDGKLKLTSTRTTAKP